MEEIIAKNDVNKVMAAIFGLVMLVYGQCGYAIIEKYLEPGVANLQKVCIDNVDMTVELATEIATYINNDRLCEIDMNGISFDDGALLIIIKSILNSKALTRFRLGWSNNVKLEDLLALGEGLSTNLTLAVLELEGNSIKSEGMEALVIGGLCRNTALTTLNLRFEEVGNGGAIALAEILLHNTALNTLDLLENYIGQDGLRVLIEALVDNYSLLNFNEDNREINKLLLRNELLRKLLLKVKRASAFTFAAGFKSLFKI